MSETCGTVKFSRALGTCQFTHITNVHENTNSLRSSNLKMHSSIPYALTMRKKTPHALDFHVTYLLKCPYTLRTRIYREKMDELLKSVIKKINSRIDLNSLVFAIFFTTIVIIFFSFYELTEPLDYIESAIVFAITLILIFLFRYLRRNIFSVIKMWRRK